MNLPGILTVLPATEPLARTRWGTWERESLSIPGQAGERGEDDALGMVGRVLEGIVCWQRRTVQVYNSSDGFVSSQPCVHLLLGK